MGCFLFHRKLADKIATAGFFVVVPDYFYGDPYKPDDAKRPIPVWVKDHDPVSILLLLQHRIYIL